MSLIFSMLLALGGPFPSSLVNEVLLLRHERVVLRQPPERSIRALWINLASEMRPERLALSKNVNIFDVDHNAKPELFPSILNSAWPREAERFDYLATRGRNRVHMVIPAGLTTEIKFALSQIFYKSEVGLHLERGRGAGIGQGELNPDISRAKGSQVKPFNSKVGAGLGLSNQSRFVIALAGDAQSSPVEPQRQREAYNTPKAKPELQIGPVARALASFRRAPLGAKIGVLTGPLIAAWLALFKGLDSLWDGRRRRGLGLLIGGFSIVGIVFLLIRP